MSATVDKSTKLRIRTSDKVIDGAGIERTAWIVLAPFSESGYVDNARYCVGNETPDEQRRLQPRRIEQTICPNSPQDYADHKIMRLWAIQNISSGNDF